MEIFSAIVQLLGGLALFLYGIEVMGDGLKNSTGSALKRVLEKVTGNMLLGVLTGTLVTAVIQSSTATIVLTVALIGAGVLNLKQAASIVMGANIGTTITAQIIRLADVEANGNFFLTLFDTDTLAPIALVVGIVMLMFIKRKHLKPVGDIFIGFGVLFIGLNLMTDGVKPLIGTSAFDSFISYFTNPVVGLVFGLVLTVIVQSSSATVGMLQTVASASVAAGGTAITFAMAYPIVLGINIGTCVTTALVCSIGTSKDAKRTGIVHILFNTIGTVLFMLVMLPMQSFGVFGDGFWNHSIDSGGIANFQLIFNLITAILLLPFAGGLVRLSTLIVRDDKQSAPLHPELLTLDEKLYISPAVALFEGTKAVAAMGNVARINFSRGCKQLLEYNESAHGMIDEDENALDNFADVADRFFIGLSKVIETDAEDRQLDMLMQSVPNFERIGDYATNIVELAQRLRNEGAEFSDSAKKELKIIIDAVDEIIGMTSKAFTEDDLDLAKQVEPFEEVIDDMVMILRDRHTKRLKTGNCSVSTGLVFMETLTYLERASDQCSSIAVMMLARKNKAIMQNHYEYLRQIHAGNDASYLAERERRHAQYILPLNEIS
ncbi:MAG: Na/Pi cotransporter family protein [Oscillospiraceae bacterium]|nr:Na/Pi cotransporter family protein [Oscillospiraceae bacterium]